MSVSVEINHKELKQMLSKVWQTKLSLNITGTVGIGKSVAVREYSEQLTIEENCEFIAWNEVDKDTKDKVMKNPKGKLVYLDIRLSQFDSTDLKGIPKIDADIILEWLIQNWLYCLTNPDVKAVVFFDEMNLAPPSVQASAYQIINDRCMGDVKLGDNVIIVSAGNSLEDKANVYDMAKPLCNRFIHATLLPPDVDDWGNWANKHGVDHRIIAYLQMKPDELFAFSPDSPENAFPTPRSWAKFVSPLIDGIDHNNKLFQKLVASAVGTGVAVTFTSWLRLQDTIDFNAILKNPKEIKKIDRIDMQFSLVAIICEWLKKNHNKQGCDTLIDMLEQLAPEFAILVLKNAVENYLTDLRKHFGTNSKWKKHMSQEYAKYLKD